MPSAPTTEPEKSTNAGIAKTVRDEPLRAPCDGSGSKSSGHGLKKLLSMSYWDNEPVQTASVIRGSYVSVVVVAAYAEPSNVASVEISAVWCMARLHVVSCRSAAR